MATEQLSPPVTCCTCWRLERTGYSSRVDQGRCRTNEPSSLPRTGLAYAVVTRINLDATFVVIGIILETRFKYQHASRILSAICLHVAILQSASSSSPSCAIENTTSQTTQKKSVCYASPWRLILEERASRLLCALYPNLLMPNAMYLMISNISNVATYQQKTLLNSHPVSFPLPITIPLLNTHYPTVHLHS